MSFLRLCWAILFFTIVAALPAASLRTEPMFSDPNSSERMLAGRDFANVGDRAALEAADNLAISLVTMGRGDPLYVWFGHSGLAVTDRSADRGVLYDYGIFSFDDEFYQTFAMGRLYYEVWATSLPARINLAIEEDRDVSEVELDLPPAAKLEILGLLNQNITQEYHTYLYHHYRENCSTRIRDIIDRAVGGQLKAWAQSISSEETIRQLVMRHTSSSMPIDWVLNFLQGQTIDRPVTLWEAMFLPSILEEALLGFTYAATDGRRVPIAIDRTVHHLAASSTRPRTLDRWQPMVLPGFLAGLAIALASILLGRYQASAYLSTAQKVSRFSYGLLNFTWSAAAGLLSVLLLFMMTASNHDVTYLNENILFVTPYLLVMAIQALKAGFGNRRSLVRFRKANTAFALLIIAFMLMKLVFIDLLIQQNWQIACTMLPIHLANSTVPFERLLARKHRVIDDSGF